MVCLAFLYYLWNLLRSSLELTSEMEMSDLLVGTAINGQGASASSTFPRWKAVTTSQICVSMALRGEAWRQAVAGAEAGSQGTKEHRESCLGVKPASQVAEPCCCRPVCTPQARASLFSITLVLFTLL